MTGFVEFRKSSIDKSPFFAEDGKHPPLYILCPVISFCVVKYQLSTLHSPLILFILLSVASRVRIQLKRNKPLLLQVR